ncbi:hypothetical protein FHX48_000299 [Microbacterium halimionae]|uniref:Uncharacterized protein n=1 Tax=Microbacterium halimionae TaxID=1526413 RepID=A0A7W3PKV4_9MICO|nr:hypothetical protein [Microbacterium halimionae]NII93962.1 hypothetical protein [Microbacterium halimionae]
MPGFTAERRRPRSPSWGLRFLLITTVYGRNGHSKPSAIPKTKSELFWRNPDNGDLT